MAMQNIFRKSLLCTRKPGLKLATSFAQPLRLSSTVGGCILPTKAKKAPSKPKLKRKCKLQKIAICSEEALAAKRKTRPCKEKIIPSNLENPECCNNPCVEMHPRFDDLYYAPSEKNKPYQQTWCEFSGFRIEKHPTCCYEQDDIPLPKRRKLGHKDISQSQVRDIARQCPNNLNPKCWKIIWPGCRTKKCDFKCHDFPGPQDCLKVCTPYPSFSECDKPLPKALPPVECDCLNTKGYCPMQQKEKA
ncbi:uncharacterized protein LOC118744866 [Rhagoletis pomonella]|uniref:uncharacterized protein LOC118744866 n=1 Tax=Rhagoletis pomonella TaxID=28610 RepID=UPI0017800779|nr:uncharacterized protein LOC118744866 [Rhagoletis pomonella]